MAKVPRGWTGKYNDMAAERGAARTRIFFSAGDWVMIRSVEGEPDLKTRHDSRTYAVRQGTYWLSFRGDTERCPSCNGRGYVRKPAPRDPGEGTK